MEAPQGATERNPSLHGVREPSINWEERLYPGSSSSENLEVLTEKVGTLGLQVIRKKRCGAAKKQLRKAKLTEAPIGDPGGGQPLSALGDQPQTLQKPSISEAHYRRGPVLAEQKSLESKGHPRGLSK